MLSILIPTYNYNAFPLVEELYKQASLAGIPFEVRCIDDASSSFDVENKKINLLAHCNYRKLPENIGRSKIRNLLAQEAQFDWLLFLDVDVIPKSQEFIAAYIPYLNDKIKTVNGGICYQEVKPEKNKVFRWLYGKNREAKPCLERQINPYVSFLTLNFLIHKSIFSVVKFNESIPNLRHEDTLFSYDLKKNNIIVEHIDNPVYHLGLDTFDVAIKKENESIIALKHLLDNQLIDPNYIKISKVFSIVNKLKLTQVFGVFYVITKKLFLKNLSSNKPSLFVFDLYRLGYICKLNNN